MDAQSSQSFTRTSQGRRDEYGEYEIIEYDGHAIKYYTSGTVHSMPKDAGPFAVDSHVKHIDQDIQGRVVNSNHKDTTIYDKDCPDDDDPNGSLLTFRNYDLVPVYPEPEGDPSY